MKKTVFFSHKKRGSFKTRSTIGDPLEKDGILLSCGGGRAGTTKPSYGDSVAFENALLALIKPSNARVSRRVWASNAPVVRDMWSAFAVLGLERNCTAETRSASS